MEHALFTRRDFLRHLTLTGGTILLPLTANADASLFTPLIGTGNFKAGHWYSSVLPNGKVTHIKRLPGGKFLALSAVCTHKGCSVAWNPADHRFHCPCHGGQFNADGLNVAGPPPRPLARLTTRVRGGVLFVMP